MALKLAKTPSLLPAPTTLPIVVVGGEAVDAGSCVAWRSVDSVVSDPGVVSGVGLPFIARCLSSNLRVRD